MSVNAPASEQWWNPQRSVNTTHSLVGQWWRLGWLETNVVVRSQPQLEYANATSDQSPLAFDHHTSVLL